MNMEEILAAEEEVWSDSEAGSVASGNVSREPPSPGRRRWQHLENPALGVIIPEDNADMQVVALANAALSNLGSGDAIRNLARYTPFPV